MILLNGEHLSKNYGDKNLLEDVNISINEGDKIGLIGINGTGKSTLLKIIAGIEHYDSGTITTTTGMTISFLPQNPIFINNLNILNQIFHNSDSNFRNENEYMAKTILTKLGITDFDQMVNNLSGGEKKRVALAEALIIKVDLLILDEPTNHIDNQMAEWLENYIKNYKGAILMVTHDRYFLDRISNRIIELDKGNLYNYSCNYSKYLELKSQRENMTLASERKRQSLYRKELDWIMRGAKARSTKQKSRIERFDDLKNNKLDINNENLKMDSLSSRLGKKTIEINQISKSYNGKTLIKEWDYILPRDGRIGIVGKNGSGKSTLLKIIIGDVKADSGNIVIGDTVNLGYFSQECDDMDISLRVIDYIKNISDSITTKDGTITASQMLERFLFSSALQWSFINQLSGGERRRLYLLGILMNAPNILLLDEPTNDLDIETLTILEDYLDEFLGAVIVVSHDRYFLDKVTSNIWEMNDDGGIVEYFGNFTDYLDKKVDEKIKIISTTKEAKQEKPRDNRKLKFSYKEQLEYNTIDDDVEKLEAKLKSMDEKIASAASEYTTLQELLQEKNNLQIKLDALMDKWIYLHDLADKIENQ